MDTFWQDLAQSALAKWIAGTAWPYPALETLHVIGLGLLFGPIVLMDLRILGFGRDLPIGALGRYLLACVWVGFGVNLVSGTLLFISNAAEFAANTPLRIKLGLIVLAGLNALVFHRRRYAATVALGPGARAPATARAAAIASIILWLGIITAGRMMAYLD